MVHDLIFAKWAAEVAGHDKPMLADIAERAKHGGHLAVLIRGEAIPMYLNVAATLATPA